MDFGPRWKDGLIDLEPPKLGKPYAVLVPSTDRFGNDASGIRSIELRVPLATYLPWHLRTGQPAGTDHLMSFTGTFVPLPLTETARQASGDGRPSIEQLYRDRAAFLARVDADAQALVRERFLLRDDVAAVRLRRRAKRASPPGSTARGRRLPNVAAAASRPAGGGARVACSYP